MAATAIVVVVVAVILLVGLVPLPSFPELAAEPDPAIPGTVAFVRSDAREQCLAIVPASGGAVTDVRCDREFYGFDGVAWTAEGDLVVESYGPYGSELVRIDPDSGEEVDRSDVDERSSPLADWHAQRAVRADGARLGPGRGSAPGEAVLRVRDADGHSRELLRVEGPEDYAFTTAQWSPDGAWVLLGDSRGRLLVLAAEGEPNPRVLVAERGDIWQGLAWYVPGETTYTVELPTP